MLGERHPSSILAIQNLAVCLKEMGDSEASELMFLRAEEAGNPIVVDDGKTPPMTPSGGKPALSGDVIIPGDKLVTVSSATIEM